MTPSNSSTIFLSKLLLAECVPVVVNRLSRSTNRGLPSYHGHSGTTADDFKVRTEFGADTWKLALSAGFGECSVFALEYPAALVHICKK